MSVWSCKDQKDSARKAMVSIPVTRDTCILEDSEDCITITNGSCTWIVNPEKDVKVSLNTFLHIRIRYRPRFFDQVGHQAINKSIENNHFFTK